MQVGLQTIFLYWVLSCLPAFTEEYSALLFYINMIHMYLIQNCINFSKNRIMLNIGSHKVELAKYKKNFI